MPREDLIPVLKQVVRGGKQHEQIYHIRPADIRKELIAENPNVMSQEKKGLHYFDLSVVGGNKEAITMYSHWEKSTTAPGAALMRGAAVTLAFKDDPAAIQEEREDFKLQQKIGGAFEEGQPLGTPKESRDAFERGLTDEQAQRNVKALAVVSQAMYDEDTVTLYRGVTGDQAKEVLASKSDVIDVDVGVLSSFTESSAVAWAFATKRGQTTGAIFEMKVPRASIVMSYRVPFAPGEPSMSPTEKEVIVMTRGMLRVPRTSVLEITRGMRPKNYEETIALKDI